MNLRVLLVSNQVRGIDSAGGLGDVPVGLAKVLSRRGDIDIRLVMPGFEKIGAKGLDHRFDREYRILEGLPVPFGDQTKLVDVYQIALPQPPGAPRIPCYLVRCPEVFDALDPRTGAVNKNSPDKAILFSRAVVEFLGAHEAFRVDVVHCNDWHSGLIPVYVKTLYREHHYLGRVATLYTTHNAGAGFQGAFSNVEELVALARLADQPVFQAGKTRSLEHDRHFNFTKGGLGFADLLNTVSRQYRHELLSPAFAGGLESLLRERADAFCGIVNGIDTSEWDPETDSTLGEHGYSSKQSVEVVRKRKRHLRDLLRSWTVPAPHPRPGERPYERLRDDFILAGVVSRIDYQKSSVLVSALDEICRMERLQLVVLGSADRNDPLGRDYERKLAAASAQNPDRILFFAAYDEPLSHLIYAASELFLVPSAFEPCGLTQLAAMRYGSVPLVRSVGGLVDTVVDEADGARRSHATGFRFKEPVDEGTMVEPQDAATHLGETLKRALALSGTPRWGELIKAGMEQDSSWEVPATQYVKLYHEAVRRCMDEAFFEV